MLIDRRTERYYLVLRPDNHHVSEPLRPLIIGREPFCRTPQIGMSMQAPMPVAQFSSQ